MVAIGLTLHSRLMAGSPMQAASTPQVSPYFGKRIIV